MPNDDVGALVCLFCGATIDHVDVDPCAAVLTATWRETAFDTETGQYWFHAKCLRERAHPTVPLYFLDLAEDA